LKYHLSDFDKVAFFDVQEAQNVLAWVSAPSNIASSNTKIFSEDVQKADCVTRLIKYKLSDFKTFFDAPVAENKFVCPFDTLKHRFIDFPRRPEG
jgi:hypothetical protein